MSGENLIILHQRLGHIGEKGLQLLHGKGMVEGMSNCSLDFDFYEHCLYGKHNRVRFPSGATRAEGILQLVHSDVFGPDRKSTRLNSSHNGQSRMPSSA